MHHILPNATSISSHLAYTLQCLQIIFRLVILLSQLLQLFTHCNKNTTDKTQNKTGYCGVKSFEQKLKYNRKDEVSSNLKPLMKYAKAVGKAMQVRYFPIRLNKKTVDKVPHRRLISKLCTYGLHDIIVNWICNFLTDFLPARKYGVKLILVTLVGMM